MAGYVFPFPWTQQPQGLIDVATDDPLFAGVDFVELGGQRIVYAPTIPAPTTSTPYRDVTAQGATDSYLTTSGINWLSPNDAWLRAGSVFTRTLLLNIPAGQSSGMIWNVSLRCDIGMGSDLGFSAGEIGFRYYDGSTFRSLSAGVISGPMQLDVVSRNGTGGGHWLYVNGVLVASDSITTAIAYTSGRDSGIGQRVTPSPINSVLFDLALAINQTGVALTADQIAMRAGRIWSVFKPFNIPITISSTPPSSTLVNIFSGRGGGAAQPLGLL